MIDFSELWEKTIQSQYGASEHLKGIIKAFAEKIDPNTDINTFYDDVFNPETAKGVGLDIWGRIVGANRYLPVINDIFFGFNHQQLQPFNQAPFFNSGSTDKYRLTDDAYRKLIFIKAKANISEATLPRIKEMLASLFPAGTVTAYNSDVMKIRVVFSYYITNYEMALFKEYGLLNIGAGVGIEFYQVEPRLTLGFDNGWQSFDNGVFSPYDVYKLNV